MMGPLEGRVAIVTGAGGFVGEDGIEGIGSAIAFALASAGAAVLVFDRDAEAAGETCRRIAHTGGDAAPYVGDVADADQCERSVAAAIDRFGRLDILVNNAAVTSSVPAHAMTEDEWSYVIDINLKGAMFMCRAALVRMMDGGGGTIVNISSAAGTRSFGNPAYAASKAGLIGLTVEIAGSYGAHAIRANTVVPGPVLTPMVQRLAGAGDRATRLHLTPLGTEGHAADVAAAVIFLCGDEARWITGVTLPVDGGMLVVPPKL